MSERKFAAGQLWRNNGRYDGRPGELYLIVSASGDLDAEKHTLKNVVCLCLSEGFRRLYGSRSFKTFSSDSAFAVEDIDLISEQ